MQGRSQTPSGRALVTEQGKTLEFISLAVAPWLEKMLSSRLTGGLLKGQEELMVFFKSRLLYGSRLVRCAASSVLQKGPLATLGARRGVPGLALYDGNLGFLLLLGAGRNRPGCWRDMG